MASQSELYFQGLPGWIESSALLVSGRINLGFWRGHFSFVFLSRFFDGVVSLSVFFSF